MGQNLKHMTDSEVLSLARALVHLTKDGKWPGLLTQENVFPFIKESLWITGGTILTDRDFATWLKRHSDAVIAWQEKRDNG